MPDQDVSVESALRALRAGIPGVTPPLPEPTDPFVPAPAQQGPEFGDIDPDATYAPAQPVSPPVSPAPPRDPEARAELAQRTAIGTEGGVAVEGGLAANEAARQTAGREAGAIETTQGNIAQENEQYHQAREKAHAEADSEVARWMADLEAKSAQEPSPRRWWDNTSGFGKALYMLGLAFGAAAQAHGAPSNVALDQVNREIEADVQRQKETLARQMDVLRVKGKVMSERQARDLADLADEHAARVQRWDALGKALDLRAKAPGDADDAVAMAKAKAYVASQMTAVATDKLKAVRTAKESALARSAEMARQVQKEQYEAGENVLDRQLKRDLAQMEISAKHEDAALKGRGEILPFPTDAVALRRGAEAPEQFAVPKEFAPKVQENLERAETQYGAFKDLSKRLGNASEWDLVLKKDPQLQSAIMTALVPVELQQGGTRAVDMKAPTNRIMSEILGADPNSWMAALRGMGPSELKAVLDRHLAELPKQTEAYLSTIPGSNLEEAKAKGYRVTFGPLDTSVSEAKPTPEDLHAYLTGEKTPPYRPQSADEAKQAEKAGIDVGSYPPELAEALDKAKIAVRTGSDKDALDVVKRASTVIDHWNKINTDTTPGWGVSSDEAAENRRIAAQAKAELAIVAERRTDRPGEDALAARIAQVHRIKGGEADMAEVKAEADKADLSLSGDRIRQLVETVNSRLQTERDRLK